MRPLISAGATSWRISYILVQMMIFVVDIGVLKGFVVDDIGRVQKVVAVDIRGNNQCCGC